MTHVWRDLFGSLLMMGLASQAVASVEIKPAPQIGPSCAFYANIPALTLHTGVDISNATEFIRPIYGLHRGDFQFGRSFDKYKFFELFSIPYNRTELKHPALPRAELLGNVRELISRQIDPALDGGKVFSLRVVGQFGGPHNVLLFSRREGIYHVHDPFPGTIRAFDRDSLAERLLVRSSASKNQPEARYVTHLVEITVSQAAWPELLTPARLPGTLMVDFDPAERAQLAKALRASEPPPAQATLGSRIAHFPFLDFAALPPKKGADEPVNIASAELEPKELLGLVRVAQFHLCLWDLRRRDLLPVLFLDGRPMVLTSYETPETGDISLGFDDGKSIVKIPLLRALERMKKDGAMIATIEVSQN